MNDQELLKLELELAELTADNLRLEVVILKDKLRFLKPFVEFSKRQIELPEGFSKLVDDNFWDLI